MIKLRNDCGEKKSRLILILVEILLVILLFCVIFFVAVNNRGNNSGGEIFTRLSDFDDTSFYMDKNVPSKVEIYWFKKEGTETNEIVWLVRACRVNFRLMFYTVVSKPQEKNTCSILLNDKTKNIFGIPWGQVFVKENGAPWEEVTDRDVYLRFIQKYIPPEYINDKLFINLDKFQGK